MIQVQKTRDSSAWRGLRSNCRWQCDHLIPAVDPSTSKLRMLCGLISDGVNLSMILKCESQLQYSSHYLCNRHQRELIMIQQNTWRRALVSCGLALTRAWCSAPMPGQRRPISLDYPRTLLILDRSTSMTGQTMADQVGHRYGRDRGDAQRMETALTLGFDLSRPSGRGAEGVEGAVGACRRNLSDSTCAPLAPLCSTGEVVVGVGPNTAPLIQAELAWPQGLRNSYTPTWQSLEKAASYAPLVQGAHDKYAILITDGWQCCGYYQQNGQGRCESAGSERSIPVEKIRLLRDQGVRVFVIGFWRC